MKQEARGREIKEFNDEPELFPHLKPYLLTFFKLKTSRSTSGFGIGFIPLSEIIKLLDEEGITNKIEREEYIKWIQYIDITDCNIENNKISLRRKKEQKKKEQSKQAQSPTRREGMK